MTTTLRTAVQCRDGLWGHVSAIITDAHGLHVTHLVVAHHDNAEDARLIPVRLVDHHHRGIVRLNCTVKAVSSAHRFDRDAFVSITPGRWVSWAAPIYTRRTPAVY